MVDTNRTVSTEQPGTELRETVDALLADIIAHIVLDWERANGIIFALTCIMLRRMPPVEAAALREMN